MRKQAWILGIYSDQKTLKRACQPCKTMKNIIFGLILSTNKKEVSSQC